MNANTSVNQQVSVKSTHEEDIGKIPRELKVFLLDEEDILVNLFESVQGVADVPSFVFGRRVRSAKVNDLFYTYFLSGMENVNTLYF